MGRGRTRPGRGRGWEGDRGRDRPRVAQSAPSPVGSRGPSVSRAAYQQPLRADKHQHDEKAEGKDVAPFEVEIEAGYRDDLGKQKGCDKPADHVAETAEHADQEGNRPEGQADERLHIVLQHQQTGGEPGKNRAWITNYSSSAPWPASKERCPWTSQLRSHPQTP